MRRSLPVVLSLVSLALGATACGVEAGERATTANRGATTIVPNEPGAATTSAPPSTTSPTRPDPNDVDRVLDDAVDTTYGLDSLALDTEAKLRIGGQRLHIHGSGSIDYGHRVADLDIGVEGPGQDGSATVLADGHTLWIQPDEVGVEVPGGKTWIATSTDRMDGESSLGVKPLLGVLLALRASRGAEVAGTKDLDGRTATGYRTTVNDQDAVEELGAEATTFRHSLSLSSPSPPDLDIVVWVGADGVIRDFHLDIRDRSVLRIGGTEDVTIRKVNEPVAAPSAPPADEVLSGPAADRLARQIFG